MKLTPEGIAKIEAVLTMIEDGSPYRAIIIKHDICDLSAFTGFLRVLRGFGVVPTRARGGRKLSAEDALAFAEFLAERRRQSEQGGS